MSQETTKKPINIFDHLNNITLTKDNFLGEEGWSNYMINRFLSMNEDYCEVVNFVQKNTWQIKPVYLYNLYKDLLPKQKVYLKYIKSQNTKKYDNDEVESIQIYFEISKKEAKEYIDSLPKEEVEYIVSQIKNK
jgi:hypothetical protein